MAFEGLTEKLGRVFKNLKSKGKLSEKDVEEAMKEVRTALLNADVNFKVAKDFTKKIADRAIGADILNSLTPAQQVIDIVHEELISLLGGGTEGFKATRIQFSSKPPTIIMMCGLQGAGKTTHAAKLAKYLRAQSRRPLLVACDVYRPAAIEQLKIVAAQANAAVYDEGQGDPFQIAVHGVAHAKTNGYDVVIIDTAGRLHIDEELMNELVRINETVKPDEILLTVDAMTGQDAVNVAKSFSEQLPLTGVILTKLDADTRGGAAISVLAVTGKPIKFAGVGEKLDDLEQFHAESMAGRILGMGDVIGLIQKAKQTVSDKEAIKTAERILENKFDLNDLYAQLEQIEKMGSMRNLLSMIPGLAGKVKEEDIDPKPMVRTKALINSMTPKERAKPSIIDAKRKRRIAAGSGLEVSDVNILLKQFDQMGGMFKHFGGAVKKGKKFGKMPAGLDELSKLGDIGDIAELLK